MSLVSEKETRVYLYSCHRCFTQVFYVFFYDWFGVLHQVLFMQTRMPRTPR